MEIRKANLADIPNIIKVLKASLGEAKLEKTETIWRYKHVENPFGESLVLVAEEEGEIIGVRAFMRWQWQRGKHIYKAFRAVDTATHPKHQGKGIFKKLTLHALEMGKKEGVHFVFNTPNAQSKPGYLKMGWQEVDKLAIHLSLVNPVYWFRKPSGENRTTNGTKESFAVLLQKYNQKQIETGQLFTPKSETYLNWRYAHNPLQEYHILREKDYYAAAYVKKHDRFSELRVVECLADDVKAKKAVKKRIGKLGRKSGVQLITSHHAEAALFGLEVKAGPVLTLREMNLSAEEKINFGKLQNWAYTLGDLELF